MLHAVKLGKDVAIHGAQRNVTVKINLKTGTDTNAQTVVFNSLLGDALQIVVFVLGFVFILSQSSLSVEPI